MRTYLGHRTNRLRSRPLGRISPPIPKVRALEGNIGSAALAAVGLLSFLDFFPLGAMVSIVFRLFFDEFVFRKAS